MLSVDSMPIDIFEPLEKLECRLEAIICNIVGIKKPQLQTLFSDLSSMPPSVAENEHGKLVMDITNHIPSIFDACNMLPEVFEVQQALIGSMEGKNNLLLSSYPNVRVDLPGRDDFLAPPHLDYWIAFRPTTIFWLPLFVDGCLEVCDNAKEVSVRRHNYWGLEAVGDDFSWTRLIIPRGKLLRFDSRLLHRSSRDFRGAGVRITVQFRFEDFGVAPRPFRRTTTQSLTDSVKLMQTSLADYGSFKLGNARDD